MRIIILIAISLGLSIVANAQDEAQTIQGKVSYKSSQNIYVKFSNTESISIGDTLFVQKGQELIPVLKVNQKSSVSVVGSAIGTIQLNVDDTILAKISIVKPEEKDPVPPQDPDYKTEAYQIPEPPKQLESSVKRKQDVRGRFALSSYSNLSNTDIDNNHRFRYTFSMNAQNIDDSKLSLETHLRFSHRSGEWSEVEDNIFNALKIYNLALKYDVSDQSRLWVGRKVNPKVANAGAIDGVQFEQSTGNFSFGAIAGFRPDYEDYGFNFDLLQFGGYVDHQINTETGSMQNTLAFFEQKFESNTDRRFAYFQHSNALLKNLFFFGSFEVDLYKLEEEQSENTFDLTAMYLSLRYRASKKLSFTGSYDRRKNVIYYETFKSLAFEILENETRQGYRFRMNYRPLKNLSFGGNIGYRSRKAEKDSKNYGAFVNYRNLPGISANANLSTTLLRTHYLKGQIYRLRLSKDVVPGKLFASVKYSYVDYKYQNNSTDLLQHIGNLNLSWRIAKKLSFSMDYESIFQDSDMYSRLYLNLIKRF